MIFWSFSIAETNCWLYFLLKASFFNNFLVFWQVLNISQLFLEKREYFRWLFYIILAKKWHLWIKNDHFCWSGMFLTKFSVIFWALSWAENNFWLYSLCPTTFIINIIWFKEVLSFSQHSQFLLRWLFDCNLDLQQLLFNKLCILTMFSAISQ